MIEALGVITIVLLIACIALLVILLRRAAPTIDFSPLHVGMESIERGQERTERGLRDDLARNRDEFGAQSKQLREEVGANLKAVGDSLARNLSNISELQRNQLESFRRQHSALAESIEKRLETLRGVVDERLKLLQDDNAKKLEQMRVTVDEKLQGTLEKRLGESFKLVSERLEQVHKGLGEMQTLATGVGDLKRVLSNVKTRGILGEVQLEMLLEQILSPEQFAANVATREGSNERVEFAIRLPGPEGTQGDPVMLPIDAKFPKEDYERLIEAHERGDADAAEAAGAQLEQRVRLCARDICEKYVNPPATTDFAIMFLPTEGLFAEVVRRVGLVEHIQQKCKVIVAGPTTLAALLNSLRMGFRTLAIQKRSSEVWTLLGAVKTEFGKFGDVLDKVKKKLDEASNQIDTAASKSRTIERKLRGVQELPAAESSLLLGAGNGEDDSEPDGQQNLL